MKEKNKRKALIIIGLLIACFLIIGVSYAVWSLTLTQTEKNVVTTGCFKIEFTDQNPITLDKAYPISDEEGKSLTPYEFTLTNTCDSEANYYINLETITSAEKKLSEQYLKTSLRKGEEEVFISNLNSSYINLDKVIPEATNAYKLYEGVLKANEKTTFSLNLWLDYNTSGVDEVINATYEGKVTVLTSYKAPPEKNLMLPMTKVFLWETVNFEIYGNSLYTQNGKYGDGIEVYYENTINPHEDAVEVVDFSAAQDKSILGYYVKRENTVNHYTLYIQADGKIKVNPNASHYGFMSESSASSSSFYGMENWDTSLVTDMSNMFENLWNDSLNLDNFDTSKVTDMNSMFYNMSNLTSIDLSNFDTSNVTDMSAMFSGMRSLTSLDLSNFDTTNVTGMGSMFYGMNSLTSLNLSSFNTQNVTDMDYMFYNARKVTTTLTIRNKDVSYNNIFDYAATEEGSQITLNYTADTESVVDAMIASKPEDSNVVKGIMIS